MISHPPPLRFIMASTLAHHSPAMILFSQTLKQLVRNIHPRVLYSFAKSAFLKVATYAALGLATFNPLGLAQEPATTDGTQQEYFEKYVRPILAEHCWSCHSGQAG